MRGTVLALGEPRKGCGPAGRSGRSTATGTTEGSSTCEAENKTFGSEARKKVDGQHEAKGREAEARAVQVGECARKGTGGQLGRSRAPHLPPTARKEATRVPLLAQHTDTTVGKSNDCTHDTRMDGRFATPPRD